MRSRRVGDRSVRLLDMTMAAAASAAGVGVLELLDLELDAAAVGVAGAASSEMTFLIRPGAGGAPPPDLPPAAEVPDWPDMSVRCELVICFSPALFMSKKSEVHECRVYSCLE